MLLFIALINEISWSNDLRKAGFEQVVENVLSKWGTSFQTTFDVAARVRKMLSVGSTINIDREDDI